MVAFSSDTWWISREHLSSVHPLLDQITHTVTLRSKSDHIAVKFDKGVIFKGPCNVFLTQSMQIGLQDQLAKILVFMHLSKFVCDWQI